MPGTPGVSGTIWVILYQTRRFWVVPLQVRIRWFSILTIFIFLDQVLLNLIHLKNQKKEKPQGMLLNDERSLAKTFHILPKMNAINSTYLQQQKKLFFLANFLDSERRWLLLLLIQTFIIKTFPLMKRGRGKRHTNTNIRYKMKK